jgi:hypothetical protein
MSEQTTLTVDVTYDPEKTDPEGLAIAMDKLMETALSTPGILDDYGNPNIAEFFPVSPIKRIPLLTTEDVERLDPSRLAALSPFVFAYAIWSVYKPSHGGWDLLCYGKGRRTFPDSPGVATLIRGVMMKALANARSAPTENRGSDDASPPPPDAPPQGSQRPKPSS